MPSVFRIALGKEFIFRVPERMHSANIKTLGKFEVSVVILDLLSDFHVHIVIVLKSENSG